MKTQKWMNLILIAGALMLPQIPALAVEGGRDGGGGNLFKPVMASPAMIKNAILKSKPVVRAFLQELDFDYNYDRRDTAGNVVWMYQSGFREYGEKYFKTSPNIYSALDKAEFVILDQGPCLDADGKEVDASAANDPKVCFSLERLAKKIEHRSLEIVVASLVVHEIAHLAGANEFDAEHFQFEASIKLSEGIYKSVKTMFENRYSAMRIAATSAAIDLQYLNDKTKPNCENIQSIHKILYREMTDYGTLFAGADPHKSMNAYSRADQSLLSEALVKTYNLLTYCPKFDINDEDVSAIYNGQKTITVEGLMRNGWGIYIELVRPAKPWEALHIIRKNDKVELRKQFTEVKTILEKLYASSTTLLVKDGGQ